MLGLKSTHLASILNLHHLFADVRLRCSLSHLDFGRLSHLQEPEESQQPSLVHAGTLIGCLPNNFVAVSAGSRLGELVSLRDLYDRRLLLLGVSIHLVFEFFVLNHKKVHACGLHFCAQSNV